MRLTVSDIKCSTELIRIMVLVSVHHIFFLQISDQGPELNRWGNRRQTQLLADVNTLTFMHLADSFLVLEFETVACQAKS